MAGRSGEVGRELGFGSNLHLSSASWHLGGPDSLRRLGTVGRLGVEVCSSTLVDAMAFVPVHDAGSGSDRVDSMAAKATRVGRVGASRTE